MAELRIGTSSFTAAGWRGSFYPSGVAQRDFLSYYATKFDTVEVDSTFYGTPAPGTVRDWYAKTPAGFVFAAKVPQVVTHEKMLVACDAELREFLGVMDELRDKLGPLLFQFPYFHRDTLEGVDEFLARLAPFLKSLPRDRKIAVEIRNKAWLVPRLLELLREHGVALALIDQPWMPRPAQWFAGRDPVTAGFTYVRWLGDRKGIEARTKIWNRTIVDRSGELSEWAETLKKVTIPIYAYANNHYSGFGPDTVEMFRRLFPHQAPALDPSQTLRAPEQRNLFG